MKMIENRSYMQRYAMLFGTYMGGFWILKFTFFPLGLITPFLFFLFIGFTVYVPFMGYRYTKIYRDRVCGGNIGFLHAWLFTTLTYMFAALLVSVVHYIYFKFLDGGFIINTYETALNEFTQTPISGLTSQIDQLKEILNYVRSLTPIDITLQLISQNVFYGALLAIPTALFAMKAQSKIINE